MEPQLNEVNPIPNIQIYMSDDGTTRLEVKLENDTVWLTQSQMALLFQKDQSVIARHIKNIFKEGELDEKSTCRNFLYGKPVQKKPGTYTVPGLSGPAIRK